MFFPTNSHREHILQWNSVDFIVLKFSSYGALFAIPIENLSMETDLYPS